MIKNKKTYCINSPHSVIKLFNRSFDFLVPLVIWLINNKEDYLVDIHRKEIINLKFRFLFFLYAASL